MQTGLTDSDNGTGGVQEPPGQGRGHHGYAGYQSGVTDRDSGPNADTAGNGRGTARMVNQTGYSDGDSGPNGDPAGYGRGRYR